jgi:uncharacterized protein YdiU (UPF0061 family)
MWNLSRFASALLPLIGRPEPLEHALEACARALEQRHAHMLHDKLGLRMHDGRDALVAELPAVLQASETDMPIFFRKLADVSTEPDASDDALLAPLLDAYYAPDTLTADARASVASWLRRYAARLRDEGTPEAERRARMHAQNPKYVLRNYLAQLAIDRAELGDASLVNELLDVLRDPYAEQPGKERFAEKRPEWARHRPGCSMLSCSS